MWNTVLSTITLVVMVLYIMIVGILLIWKIFDYLNTKNRLRNLEIENAKYEIFMKMDPKMAETEIEDFIKGYLNNYVLTNFIATRVNYIRDSDVEDMVHYLDRAVILEMSELHLFYIKIIRNISTQDDLIVFVDKKVKEIVLGFVTEFNKPNNG